MKSLALLFLLSSCASFVNVSTGYKPTVYTRMSNSIFFQNPAKVKNIYIKTSNLTGYSEFSNFKNKISKDLSQEYTIVSNPDLADVIFDVKIRQFSEISEKVIQNIERYWQYNDSSEQTTIKEIGKNGFSISDDSVSIGDAQNGNLGSSSKDLSNDSVLSKFLQNDFISGLSVGGVAGFFVTSSSPIGAVIGGMFGGGSSLALQKYTKEKSFMATIDIDISEKVSQNVSYEEKYLHKQDDNGMRWHNTKYEESFVHKRVKMFGVVKKAILNHQSAAEILSSKLSSSFAEGI